MKTLGFLWDDVFLLQMQSNMDSPDYYTKRIVLSKTAKIFDPLGLLEPVPVLAKLFIQQLWSLELNWDDPLPVQLEAEWRRFKNQLQLVNELRVPRRVVTDDAALLEIHGFSDASKKAHGACVYFEDRRYFGKLFTQR